MGRAIAMYRKAEKLDPGVYTHMRDVPIEYQKEKQKEYRVMELQPDEGDLADEFNEMRIDQVRDRQLTFSCSDEKASFLLIKGLLFVVRTSYKTTNLLQAYPSLSRYS